MAELIEKATRIPVPGGKVIDEYVGRVNSGETAVSVAHMVAPGGWDEPAQTPDFDEYTLVLRGSVRVEHRDRRDRRDRPAARSSPGPVSASGTPYRTGRAPSTSPSACPAFAPDLAHRDDDSDADGDPAMVNRLVRHDR